MHTVIKEIAERVNLPTNRVEEAVSLILVRVRADLETVGEAEVEGLGTFRMIDDSVTFEPAPDFAIQINKEFAAMRPIALTATGESVEVDDERALPGSGASFSGETYAQAEANATEIAEEQAPADVAETATESEEAAEVETGDALPANVASESVEFVESVEELDRVDEDVEDGEKEPELAAADEGTIAIASSEDETVDLASTTIHDKDSDFTFETPPPPFPSKIRVPPGERRSRHRRHSESREDNDFPDMGSVVTTRPVEPIHTAGARHRRSKVPLFVAAAVVLVAIGAFLIVGTGQRGQSTEQEMQASPAAVEEQAAPAEAVAEEETASESVASEPAESQPESESSTSVDEPEPGPSTATQVTAPAEEVEPEGQPAAAEPEEPTAQSAENVQTPPEATSEPIYSWIVASYPNRAEAVNRSSELQAAGFDARVYEATVGGERAFRVGVGQYGTQADAWGSHSAVPPEATDAWVVRVK